MKQWTTYEIACTLIVWNKILDWSEFGTSSPCYSTGHLRNTKKFCVWNVVFEILCCQVVWIQINLIPTQSDLVQLLTEKKGILSQRGQGMVYSMSYFFLYNSGMLTFYFVDCYNIENSKQSYCTNTTITHRSLRIPCAKCKLCFQYSKEWTFFPLGGWGLVKMKFLFFSFLRHWTWMVPYTTPTIAVQSESCKPGHSWI